MKKIVMRRIILTVFAAVAIFLVSCSNESKIIRLMENTTEKYEKAQTEDEVTEIASEFAMDAFELVNDMGWDEAVKLSNSPKVKKG